MYALRTIHIPGTLAAGYQRGHFLPDSVAESWGLVEGEDYATEMPGDDDPGPVAVARPADDSDRGAWVAYAISQGADPDEAREMQLSELMDAYPELTPDGDPMPERPAESAKKAEWVEFVIAAGADEEWARSSDTTKADLQEWEPGAERTAPVQQETTDPAADQGNATVGQ